MADDRLIEPFDEKTKKEKLEELRDLIIDYVDSEKLRLQVERDFLTSVKDNSLKYATMKADKLDSLNVFDNLVSLLGLLSQEELTAQYQKVADKG